jgi:hypothetical protein
MTPAQREGLPLAEGRPTLREIVLTALGVLMIILVCSVMAQAKWKPDYASSDPVIHHWFEAQTNANGQRCCDKSDGHRYDGAYTLNADGSVTLHLKEGAHILPKAMVLTGPNPTGHAVWWYISGPGWHADYCFAPGTLS